MKMRKGAQMRLKDSSFLFHFIFFSFLLSLRPRLSLTFGFSGLIRRHEKLTKEGGKKQFRVSRNVLGYRRSLLIVYESNGLRISVFSSGKVMNI